MLSQHFTGKRSGVKPGQSKLWSKRTSHNTPWYGRKYFPEHFQKQNSFCMGSPGPYKSQLLQRNTSVFQRTWPEIPACTGELGLPCTAATGTIFVFYLVAKLLIQCTGDPNPVAFMWEITTSMELQLHRALQGLAGSYPACSVLHSRWSQWAPREDKANKCQGNTPLTANTVL